MSFFCCGGVNFRMALLHLILPYTYGVYSDFVTSSVKSEIKLLNAEDLVSVRVYYSKMGKLQLL